MCHYAVNWCDKLRFFAFMITESNLNLHASPVFTKKFTM